MVENIKPALKESSGVHDKPPWEACGDVAPGHTARALAGHRVGMIAGDDMAVAGIGWQLSAKASGHPAEQRPRLLGSAGRSVPLMTLHRRDGGSPLLKG
jgi:hypothetical protein